MTRSGAAGGGGTVTPGQMSEVTDRGERPRTRPAAPRVGRDCWARSLGGHRLPRDPLLP